MTDIAARAGRREWLALSVLLLPLLLVSMDVSVLYFAVPYITRDLAPTSTQQLWIFDIYAFVLAGLLMTMGAVGDRIGRRRLLLIGAAAFGAASVAAAYAHTAEMLIVARAVLGIGGATLMPSTMALVRNLFHDEKQRSMAIAIWSSTMAGGVALGSVLSGVLLEHFWWGSIFLINVPAMVLLLVLAPILVPEFRAPVAGRFDLVSVPLSMAAVLPVIYGLKQIAADGFAFTSAGCIVGGLAIGAAFVHRQRTIAHPMISPTLFARRGFGTAIGLNLVGTFAMMGSAYFTTQYLQSVLGKSPLTAALWSLLPTVAVAVAAPIASMLVQRGVGRARVTAAGFALAAAGFVVLTQTDITSLWMALAGAAVLASGIVIAGSQLTDLALGLVAPERAGAASSLMESGQEFGGALGMALLGSIGTAVYRADVGSQVPEAARETLGGAMAVAQQLPGRAGEHVLEVARTAFTHGMHVAAIVAAVALVGAAVAALRVREQTAEPQPERIPS